MSENKKSEQFENKKGYGISSVALPFVLVTSLMLGFIIGILVMQIPKIFEKQESTKKYESQLSDQYLDQEYLDQVYQYLDQIYIGELPTREELTHGAVKGMIDSLDDQYTSFLTPEETNLYLEGRTSDFEGIGITLAFDGEYTYVESVIDGFPASQTQIGQGDVILEVDGEDMSGKIPALVASKIRGEKGTQVSLKMYTENSSGVGDIYDVVVTRDRIEIENITWEYEGEGIYRIDISQFSDETPELFKQNWDAVVSDIISQEQNAEGIIVDLRNNPGGYVISVRYVVEEFLKNGQVIMKEESKIEESTTFQDFRKGKFEDIDLVVLVNESSASASEIFAAAIQDNERGQVVGMPTAGKGVEQLVIDDFEDGAMMLLVFQKWLTPNGTNISSENPIIPDIEVEFTDSDLKDRNDPQLKKAIELLK